jgi:hypothetical protein
MDLRTNFGLRIPVLRFAQRELKFMATSLVFPVEVSDGNNRPVTGHIGAENGSESAFEWVMRHEPPPWAEGLADTGCERNIKGKKGWRSEIRTALKNQRPHHVRTSGKGIANG